MEKIYDVVGLANTLMDFLVRVDNVEAYGLIKGETQMVSEQDALNLLEKIKVLGMETSPGGSVANTVKAISMLGGKTSLYGSVGQDEHGENYEQAMKKHGVSVYLNKDLTLTGHCLAFITPDSERSFCFHLGAAAQLTKDHVLEGKIAQSKILHLEAFQLEGSTTKEAVIHAIDIAKRYGTLVSIDLSDPRVIREQRETLWKIVKESADIVFANENEAKEITGLSCEYEAAKELSQHVEYAIVKLGGDGSLIYNKGNLTKIDAFKTNPIDTTGAGDSYAAGVLYGICNNWELSKAGELGSLISAKVIEQIGAGMNDINCEELKMTVNKDYL